MIFKIRLCHIFFVLMFFSQLCYATTSCRFEEVDDAKILPFNSSREYLPERGKAFFDILESNPDCIKNDFDLPRYSGWTKKTAKMIIFIYYFEGMPGILNSFIGQCIKTDFHSDKIPVDYNCSINVR